MLVLSLRIALNCSCVEYRSVYLIVKGQLVPCEV